MTNNWSLLRFSTDRPTDCSTYISENGTNTGCLEPLADRQRRFFPFYTKLSHDNETFEVKHSLIDKGTFTSRWDPTL